jgi:hypothetical protein
MSLSHIAARLLLASANENPSNKDSEGSGDEDGSYMSVQALNTIHKNSEALMSHIQQGSVLPDWVESKLTRANTDLGDVAQFFTSQKTDI